MSRGAMGQKYDMVFITPSVPRRTRVYGYAMHSKAASQKKGEGNTPLWAMWDFIERLILTVMALLPISLALLHRTSHHGHTPCSDV
ncbi:hypothetical protein FKM82_004717 [Ascaphus truei]